MSDVAVSFGAKDVGLKAAFSNVAKQAEGLGATFAKVLLFKGDELSVFASYLIRIKFREKINNTLYWYFNYSPIIIIIY
jgi:hypothetical protein